MKDILVVPHLHLDPLWRRAFDRPARKHGITVRSYAEIEEHAIEEWLRLAPKGYTYSDGQAAVWRKYLQRNPGRLAALRKAARAGKLDMLLAGEVVPDSNLSTAEGLVRNFLVAQPLYRDLVDEDHPGLKLAWLEDAFGNSANYPQVLAGVGAEVACATTYRVCPDPVWVGIDGTAMPCLDHYPSVRCPFFDKYPPCEECRGAGCASCNGTGLGTILGMNLEAILGSLEKALAMPGEWAAVTVFTEEVKPDARIGALIRKFNRTHAGRAQARFANPSDVFARYREQLAGEIARLGQHASPDLNPAMPGCMVSRIRCKQRTRGIAYQLIAAEAHLANLAWKNGKAKRPPAALERAWQHICFNQFHDAITGTHIDTAYRELMDMLDSAEKTARKHAPAPAGVKAPAKTAFKVRTSPVSMKLGKFDIEFDRCGLLRVDCNGRDLFGRLDSYNGSRRPYRIAELVMETDFGDAWGQRIPPFPVVTADSTRVSLGDYQTSVATTKTAIRWTGRYTGPDPKVKKLAWTVTMQISGDGERLDFVTEVDWDTASRRLRVLVPVASKDNTATYEIPYGFIDRTFEWDKQDYSFWRSNTMEFPTLHWARKAIDNRSGVALLNKGLPCVRWMPGRFDLSLLRSPEFTFCAEEAGNYEFWDIDGQRDAGRHSFEYSIWPYYESLSPHELTVAGYAFNEAALSDRPFILEGHAVVTAWKLAEDGSGWILRLQETNGEDEKIVLTFEESVSLTPTDLLERSRGADPASVGERHEVSIHRHGIKTFLVRRGAGLLAREI
jgi:hypothetical protein